MSESSNFDELMEEMIERIRERLSYNSSLYDKDPLMDFLRECCENGDQRDLIEGQAADKIDTSNDNLRKLHIDCLKANHYIHELEDAGDAVYKNPINDHDVESLKGIEYFQCDILSILDATIRLLVFGY